MHVLKSKTPSKMEARFSNKYRSEGEQDVEMNDGSDARSSALFTWSESNAE